MKRRWGFSLVEMLIVVAIVALLAAIAIPAVMAMRRSARMVQCQSNLRQIGIALAAYEQSHGVYPLGISACTPRIAPDQCNDWTGWSVHAHLLPYLDQPAVFDAINFNWGTYSAPEDIAWLVNGTAMNTVVSAFLCPADVKPILTDIGPHRWWNRGGMNNYAASMGPDMVWDNASGLFFRKSAVRTGMILDGMTKTIAFSERLRGDQDRMVLSGTDLIAGQPWPGAFPASFTPSPDNHVPNRPDLLDQYVAQCDAAAPGSTAGDYNLSVAGMMWAWGAMGQTLFNTVLPPNAPHYDCSRNCKVCMAEWDGLHTARSYHSGGVNVLMADGAVAFIPNQIERTIWWALGTRAGYDRTEGF